MGACSYAFLHLHFYNVVLSLFMFLVASFSSGCFFYSFCSPLSRASWGSVLLLATFSCFCFVLFVFCFCFSWAVFHPARSQQFAELGSIDFLAFSARACSLAFLCLAVLCLGTCMTFYFIFYFNTHLFS